LEASILPFLAFLLRLLPLSRRRTFHRIIICALAGANPPGVRVSSFPHSLEEEILPSFLGAFFFFLFPVRVAAPRQPLPPPVFFFPFFFVLVDWPFSFFTSTGVFFSPPHFSLGKTELLLLSIPWLGSPPAQNFFLSLTRSRRRFFPFGQPQPSSSPSRLPGKFPLSFFLLDTRLSFPTRVGTDGLDLFLKVFPTFFPRDPNFVLLLLVFLRRVQISRALVLRPSPTGERWFFF